ncbi:late competence protein ComER [Thalassorhabdus alkalitolerans]|uniref:Pyrroline-5-carboxylate reductase n=1 Tax=Thalassorhabdus alkalitolerans TaxID=2282697 RepID=A0ABW0YSW4_9BACI
MQVGVIGTGNMGRILVETIVESGAAQKEEMIITNRTLDKAKKLADAYPGIKLKKKISDVVKQSNLLFVCVRPLQFPDVLQEIAPYVTRDHIVSSITSPVEIGQLEQSLPCKVMRSIPSITNRAGKGVLLLTYGSNWETHEKEKIANWFSEFSHPYEIEEKVTRVASDIVSCGPAFFSYLLQSFIDAAVSETEIERKDAEYLTAEMIQGLSSLFEKGFYTLPSLQKKVHVPGGITGEGLKVLHRQSEGMFEDLFKATHEKYYEDKELLAEKFTKRQDS